MQRDRVVESKIRKWQSFLFSVRAKVTCQNEFFKQKNNLIPLFFCKHPNLYRRLILEEKIQKKKKNPFFSFFEGRPDFRWGARGSPLKIGNPKMALKGG